MEDTVKEEPVDFDFPTSNQSNVVVQPLFHDSTAFKDEVKQEPEDDYEAPLRPAFSTETVPKDEVKEEPDCLPSTSSTPAVVMPKSKVVTRVVQKCICSMCGEIFKFRFQLVQHLREKEHRPISTGKRKLAKIEQAVRVHDVRKENSWKGHTRMEGCAFVGKPHVESKAELSHPGTITYIDCGVCGDRFANARDHRSHAIKIHPHLKEDRLCKNEYCVRKRIIAAEFIDDEGYMSENLRAILAPMYDSLACPVCWESQNSYFHFYVHFCREHATDHCLKFRCTGCSHVYTSPRGLKKHIVEAAATSERCNGGASFLPPALRKKRLADVVQIKQYQQDRVYSGP